jgi:DNA-binding NarL/FixJ family response regulator
MGDRMSAGLYDRMNEERPSCVLLADRHHGLSEGVRGLLETVFNVVVMVADETSLIEGAKRLHPTLAVVDISLARSEGQKWIAELHSEDPELKVILLSVHDEASVCRKALADGANGYVLKRDIATELLPGIAAVLAGEQYVSTGVSGQQRPGQEDIS